ncbi:hypothetical protein B0H14DRAFT_43874 [Mycena olivaceomarginata]|nr:hypothetical protein B0H14DRAFT_43874 [Mycena olivaceomarginata]
MQGIMGAPMLGLPHEMLAEIFYNFLPIYPMCSGLVGLQSPTLLSHVCRRWRNIALSLPRLWRAIKLDIVREPHPQQLDLLRTWLGRSGDHLVEMDQSRVLNSCEAVQLTAILQHLLQHLYCSISRSDLCNSTLQL